MFHSPLMQFLRKSWRWCGLLVAIVFAALPLRAADDDKAPPLLTTNNIRSIVTRGNTVVVGVVVPEGTNQVMLQSQPTVKGGGWKPLAVRRVTGASREIVFSVAKGKTKTSYRAVIQPAPLPAKFYRGRTTFPPAKGSDESVALVGGTLAAPVAADPNQDPTTPPETIAESDIWNIDNNRLYFFNQYRGLQVMDISNPDSPALLGTLSLAASGEQMYVLDSGHVLLLTQDCSGSGNSGLALVDVSAGVPTLLTNLPLSGYVSDSRQVGTTVFLASTSYDGSTNGGTEISSFDFSNPASPVAAATLDLPGWNNTLTVSGNYLLAISPDATNYYESDIACIDISSGNGAMTLESTIRTDGLVQDQFAVRVTNDILTAISETWNNAQDFAYFGQEMRLQNFSLTNPAGPVLVGAINLDSQWGTARFDANRAYIAAGFGELLMVLDLSDPTNPVEAGYVYGSSPAQSFIFPLGNHLVTIGPDINEQTCVSLFDVTDAYNPYLLSQVDLGTNYSWSEAEYDFQAFTLLPSAGLILVPYQTYDPTGASASGIQLIDLNPNSLALRGVIAQAQARRATYLNNRVLSVSGTDLLTADISNQDGPVITDDLVLSWAVDQVFLSGSYLVELSTGVYEGGAPPVITVAAAAAPNLSLGQWTLTNSYVLGATVQGNYLYLLQGPYSPEFFPPPLSAGDSGSVETNEMTLTLSVVDLGSLPALSIVGETNFAVTQAPDVGVQAVWPQPGTLVWVAPALQEWFWPLAEGVVRPVPQVPAAPGTPLISPTPVATVTPPNPGITVSPGGGSVTTITFAPPPTSPAPISPVTTSAGSGFTIVGLAGPGGPPLPPSVQSLSAQTASRVRHFATRKTRRATKSDAGILPLLPWYYNGGGMNMYAFDVSDVGSPTLVSTTTVGTNGWPDGNAVFATNGLVYVDHSVWDYIVPAPVVRPPPKGRPGGLAVKAPTIIFPPDYFNENSELDVVDFTVPSSPIVRDPVAIPGALAGISRGGNVVYTLDFNGSLAALAYDGMNVYQVATLPSPADGFQETLVADETVFTAQTTSTNYTASELEAWTLNDSGVFVKEGLLPLPQPVYALADFGNMLALQTGAGVTLVDFTNPASLTTVGSALPNGCLWLTLTGADGALGSGLWVPLGAYGVFPIPTP